MLEAVGNGADHVPALPARALYTVLFTKMGQQVRVTRVIVTLQVTKYPCPLNFEEIEPTLTKGFKRIVGFKKTACEPIGTTGPS